MTNMKVIRFVSMAAATVCLDGCASGRLTLVTKSQRADMAFVRAWTLQKAWRTAPDGSVIEEYPVP